VLLVFYMLGGFALLVSLSCFIYPAFKSLQAITANDQAEDKQWLSYWVSAGRSLGRLLHVRAFVPNRLWLTCFAREV
jgi:hypothetical protein